MTIPTQLKTAGSIVIALLIGGFMVYLRCNGEKERERQWQKRSEQIVKGLEAQHKRQFEILTPEEAKDQKELIAFAESFLRDVTSDNVSAAYEKTTKAFKEKTSLTEFKEFVRANPVINSPDECSYFGNLSSPGGSMSVSLGKQNDVNKITTIVNVTVVKQGTMKVSDFTIKPKEKPNP